MSTVKNMQPPQRRAHFIYRSALSSDGECMFLIDSTDETSSSVMSLLSKAGVIGDKTVITSLASGEHLTAAKITQDWCPSDMVTVASLEQKLVDKFSSM